MVYSWSLLRVKYQSYYFEASARRTNDPNPKRTYFQYETESDVVTDSSIPAGLGGEVSEPDARDPVLVKIRFQALKLSPLFLRHETCPGGEEGKVQTSHAARGASGPAAGWSPLNPLASLESWSAP